MKISFFRFGRFYAGIVAVLLLTVSAWAQSTNPDAPTNVSGAEISGAINARDLGDARLTTYYYRFDGSQGDVFINVKADNFSGDIDIFYVEGLRPVSKITFYADDSLTETGRVIYLRKAEQLLLRVQGRTPDDKPATFQIKFAGSFVALQNNSDQTDDSPTVKKEDTGDIRVNSVGTIIERKTEKTEPEETVAKSEPEPEKAAVPETSKTDEPVAVAKSIPSEVSEPTETAKTEEENKSAAKVDENVAEVKTEEKTETPAETVAGEKPAKIVVSKKPRRSAKTQPQPEKTAEPKIDPLENVRLVVLLKTGEKIEYPMTQVFRFAMNNGVLTVTTKDGKIARYPIIEVLKMTVE